MKQKTNCSRMLWKNGDNVPKHNGAEWQVWKRLYRSFTYSYYTHWQLISYFLSFLFSWLFFAWWPHEAKSATSRIEMSLLVWICPPSVMSSNSLFFFFINLTFFLQQLYDAVHNGSIMSKASLPNLQSQWIKKTVIYQIWYAPKSLQSWLWKHLKQYSRESVEVKCNIKYSLDLSVGLWVLDGCQHSVLSKSPNHCLLCSYCAIIVSLCCYWLSQSILVLTFHTHSQVTNHLYKEIS